MFEVGIIVLEMMLLLYNKELEIGLWILLILIGGVVMNVIMNIEIVVNNVGIIKILN